MLPEVRLNASALSPNALYVDIDISTILPNSSLARSGKCLTIRPADVPLFAVGFNSCLRALIDSGSSHYFVSPRICELHHFLPYAISPVNLRYLDGSSSTLNRKLMLPRRVRRCTKSRTLRSYFPIHVFSRSLIGHSVICRCHSSRVERDIESRERNPSLART